MLHGRLEESQELLNLFTRECKEDAKDMKLQVAQTSGDLDSLSHSLRQQAQVISTLQREQVEVESKLRSLN